MLPSVSGLIGVVSSVSIDPSRSTGSNGGMSVLSSAVLGLAKGLFSAMKGAGKSLSLLISGPPKPTPADVMVENTTPEIVQEAEDEVDLTEMMNQMNSRQNEDEQWDIKDRIVRPAVELTVTTDTLCSSTASGSSEVLKSVLKKAKANHVRNKVQWVDKVNSETPLSQIKEIDKETAFQVYTPSQQQLFNVLSELACRTEPEKGTYGYGFTILGKSELDKERVWNPDQVIAQNARSLKKQAKMKADVKRLSLPDSDTRKITPFQFLKNHVKNFKKVL